MVFIFIKRPICHNIYIVYHILFSSELSIEVRGEFHIFVFPFSLKNYPEKLFSLLAGGLEFHILYIYSLHCLLGCVTGNMN